MGSEMRNIFLDIRDRNKESYYKMGSEMRNISLDIRDRNWESYNKWALKWEIFPNISGTGSGKVTTKWAQVREIFSLISGTWTGKDSCTLKNSNKSISLLLVVLFRMVKPIVRIKLDYSKLKIIFLLLLTNWQILASCSTALMLLYCSS